MTHIEPLPYEFKRTEKYMGKEDEVTVSLEFPFTILIDKLNEVIGDYEHLKEVVLCRQLENNQLLGSSIPESPPLESKYEECAKEMSEYLLPSGYEEELIPILKKYF